MKKILGLTSALVLTACAGPVTEEAQPRKYQPAGQFVLEVDPVNKTATFTSDFGQTVSQLHVSAPGYHVNGVDGAEQGTFDAVTNQATIRGPGEAGCAATRNCFEVHINNNTGSDFTNFLMRIDSTIPIGHGAANPDPLPLGAGISANMGVFNFGDIPNGTASAVKDVQLDAGSAQPFHVVGSWWIEGPSALFQDNFEDGDFTANPTWVDSGGTYSVKEVTNTLAANGTNYSLHMVGGSDHRQGLSFSAANITPSHITYYVRTEQTTMAGAYLVLENSSAQNFVWIYFQSGGDIRSCSSSGCTNVHTYAASTWYKIELRNIDWVADTYDLWIDDALVDGGAGFRSAADGIATIHHYNYHDAESYWDELLYE